MCQADHGLTAAEAAVMRAAGALRDGAQHWFVFVSEDLLYLQTRAAITAFDGYLKRSLHDDLASHIPPRVLPVSTKPAGAFEFLVDREYALVAELLKPKKRKRDEARARIRTLLALEALVADEVSSPLPRSMHSTKSRRHAQDHGRSDEGFADYLLQIAMLGGYLARNCDPPPGNMVVWRGLNRLHDMAVGITIGASRRCG